MVSAQGWQTCLICRGTDHGDNPPTFRIGTRHNVHAECGFKKWGVAFLDKIERKYAYQLGTLPAPVAKKYGCSEELERRYSAYLERQKKAEIALEEWRRTRA